MEKFNWQEADDRALHRYNGLARAELPVAGPWQTLVEQVSRLAADRVEASAPYADAFARFLTDLDRQAPPRPLPAAPGIPHPSTCCVFISHRQSDINNALHIAWLVTQAGYDYWLDIHDPTLNALNGSAIPSPAKDILLAAAIEIALLNSTHVIALHTQHSIGANITLSKWIPYELGRAKARQITSDQAACWFDRHTQPAACGEYVYLVRHTRTAIDINAWLASTHQGRCTPSKNKAWKYGAPPPLDP